MARITHIIYISSPGILYGVCDSLRPRLKVKTIQPFTQKQCSQDTRLLVQHIFSQLGAFGLITEICLQHDVHAQLRRATVTTTSMNLTTIFQNHQLNRRQRDMAGQFMNLLKQHRVNCTSQLSICVLGARQTGKTSTALCFAQAPILELPPSKKSSVIQAIVRQKYGEQIILIHDSYEFLLANTVILLIDATRPETSAYLRQFISQLYSTQLCFVFVNKCDLATHEQLGASVQEGLRLVREVQVQNRCRLCCTSMHGNSSFKILLDIMGLSVMNQRYQNAQAEMLRAQKDFSRQFQTSQREFHLELNEQLKKRGVPPFPQQVVEDEQKSEKSENFELVQTKDTQTGKTSSEAEKDNEHNQENSLGAQESCAELHTSQRESLQDDNSSKDEKSGQVECEEEQNETQEEQSEIESKALNENLTEHDQQVETAEENVEYSGNLQQSEHNAHQSCGDEQEYQADQQSSAKSVQSNNEQSASLKNISEQGTIAEDSNTLQNKPQESVPESETSAEAPNSSKSVSKSKTDSENISEEK